MLHSVWSRRTFLAAGTLVARDTQPVCAFQQGTLPEAQAGKPRGRLPRSRLSAITDEVAFSEAAAFDFAKRYRLRWIELRTVPGTNQLYAELGSSALRKFRSRVEDAGLGISFLNTWILKWTLPDTEPRIRHRYDAQEWKRRVQADADRFARREELLKRAMEAAHELGVETIRIFTFWRTDSPLPLYPRIAEIIAPLAELAAREKLRLLIENESACNVATSWELQQMLALVPHRAVGFNWDPHNSLAFEAKPFPAGYQLLPKERLGNVQIKGESLLKAGETLDWAGIVDALLDDGYRGPFGLETHFGDAEQRIRNAHHSMEKMVAMTDG